MKIAFIEPKPPINLYFFLRKFPLLGLLYLGKLLKDAGHQVSVLKEDIVPAYNKTLDKLHPTVQDADVVGITAITHTVNRAYTIAKAIKRKYPDKKVIIGGNHSSAMPEEAAQYADQVVVGEGESVVVDLFEGRIRDKIVYGDHIDINNVPPLDLSLLQGYSYKENKIDIPAAPIMASRGCPYDCDFCSVTKMFGRKYRKKDPDLIMEEVRMRYQEGFRNAFFYDDNFAANPHKTKEFLEKLIRADLDFTWDSQFSIHVAHDNELLDLLRKAKCNTMYIGIESINPEALKEYNKRQDVKKIRDSLKKLQDKGFKIHSMFILGADSDDEKTIEETIKFSKDCGSFTAQFSILFPIPGTRLYQRLKEENRLIINNWNYYDGSHVVFLPKKISPFKLQQKFVHAYKYFYNTTPLRWLASRFGFLLWKKSNRKYWKHLKNFFKKTTETRRSSLRRKTWQQY